MRFPTISALAAVALLSPCAHAAVNFFEGFETPLVPDPPGFVGIPDGTAFDNGWTVLSTSEFSVYLVEANFEWAVGNPLAGDSQAVVFGGGQLPGGVISILVGGFTDMELPSIKFDHWADGTEGQTTIVTVTDPNDGGNELYSNEATGDGSVDGTFTAQPVGDEVLVTVTQGGSSTDSDASIDNLMITAIPEPSISLLGALGVLIGLIRRRR